MFVNNSGVTIQQASFLSSGTLVAVTGSYHLISCRDWEAAFTSGVL